MRRPSSTRARSSQPEPRPRSPSTLSRSPRSASRPGRGRTRTPQLAFAFRTWGGKRAGAGRKPARPGAVTHRARPPLASRYPVHVTLGVDPSLPSLRSPRLGRAVESAFRGGKQRGAFRLVHYAIQRHHLHLMVEAKDARTLARGMQGLTIRLARAINRVLGRRGRVFVDRYFARILRRPRQVRHCLLYVLSNARRHAAQGARKLGTDFVDR